VLLVTPLAAPSLCFDLRRGCSLVEHLVEQGRPTYVVEYGQVSFKNRGLGMEHWVDEVLPEAVRAVHEHSGGRPVHLVGWSLGGIFALLTAADGEDLPIASLTVVGSPVDVTKVPLVAPVRPLLNLTQGRGAITRVYRALGGVPTPLVNWAFTAASAQKVLTKPLAVLTHLDDTDYLAQLEAVDRFMNNMTAYPGRTFGQLYHRFVKGNALATGRMEVGDRTVDLGAITVPVLVFAGNTDGIAPLAAVRAVVPLLTGSPEVRFEVVPGGHLGMLTGRAARGTTWQVIDEWVARWSTGEAVRPAKKAPASPGTIGSNPTRRYGSAGSRALGQR
jgi:polyhydroxyalkanoate synthase